MRSRAPGRAGSCGLCDESSALRPSASIGLISRPVRWAWSTTKPHLDKKRCTSSSKDPGTGRSATTMADGCVLIEPVRAFLSAPRCAVLSTIGTDGAPRQIVIHYLLGEDHLRLNGHRDRRWVANL